MRRWPASQPETADSAERPDVQSEETMESQQCSNNETVEENYDMKNFMKFVRQSLTNLSDKVDSIAKSQKDLEKKCDAVLVRVDANENAIKDLKDSSSESVILIADSEPARKTNWD